MQRDIDSAFVFRTWRLARFCALLGAIYALAASSTRADPIKIGIPYGKFGHLGNAGPLCAPTATANSIGYLVNYDPEIYAGTDLLRGDPSLVLARNSLAGGWIVPGLPRRPGMASNGQADPKDGALARPWWETKVQYFMDFAPGTTFFKGMVNADTSTWLDGSALTRGVPTFDFLWNELSDHEDVELDIVYGPPGNQSAHALTLAGLSKPTDTHVRTITYLDPNNPSKLFTADLKLLPDGSMGFHWNNENNPAQDVSIQMAFSESPHPEPSTLALLAAAIVGLPFRRWRGRAAASRH